MTAARAEQTPAEPAWRFPRGSGALPPEVFDEVQRIRIFEATCALVAERGYAKTTVAKILRRAGMSTKTFYDYFDDKESGLLAAYRSYSAQLAAELAAAWSHPQRWADKVVAAIAALLSFGAEQPDQLRFLLLDAFSAGPGLLAAQREALELLAARLREGRGTGKGAADLAPSTEEMIAAGIAQRVGRCLLEGDRLADLQGELVEFALGPYLGGREAREVANRAQLRDDISSKSAPPPAHGTTSPALVDEIQRRRIFDSLATAAAERGYAATTIGRILRHAHVAQPAFSALFESKDDCFLAANRAFADRLEVELGDAWQAEQSWPAKVRAAISAALAFAAEQPAAARLLAVEIQAAGPTARAEQADSIDRLASALREGRRFYPGAAGLNRFAEAVLVAGIVGLIGNRLLEGEAERLPDLEDELVELALAPYLGAGPARA